MEQLEIVNKTVELLKKHDDINNEELIKGENLYDNSSCISLYHSQSNFQFIVNDEYEDHTVSLDIDKEAIVPITNKSEREWDRYSLASLFQLKSDLEALHPKEKLTHKKYTREGMINRVLKERGDKAAKAEMRGDYKVQWADNIYGDHLLINERGKKYKVFLRDFESETGYSDSDDARYNKLGTTKHIMYVFQRLREDTKLFKRLDKKFPFVEIYLDPLNDYQISWFYPEKLPEEAGKLIRAYFGRKKYIKSQDEEISFLSFLEKSSSIKQIKVRPEVRGKIERIYDEKLLRSLEGQQNPDLSFLKVSPFPYQVEGVKFATFRKACILADEMGLGKTLQAMATAIAKQQVFGFKKTLVVCPASLKEQWKNEIEKFTGIEALIIEGTPEERKEQYQDPSHFFYIVNYEAVRRDYVAIGNGDFDFLILDEAQRVKNFETKTFLAIKKIVPKHVLAITGTPIENRLIDIYSIMQIIDPEFLGPLWEFSYKHCLFDEEKPNKINGYYNLNSLKSSLDQIVLRREKRRLLDQLPGIRQIDVPILLSEEQASYHSSYANSISRITKKKFITPVDMELLMMYLMKMRMVCNSTYLVDEETNVSPKLDELERILIDKLDLRQSDKKVIIFSEWLKSHKLIGQLLRKLDIGFTELNGTVPVKKRGALIRKFEKDKRCKVFLSTEAGGTGLNLQMADTLINFELPWNPAKKNQRIGRIDRIGQKNANLTIINLITKQSIEARIAAGLLVKQDLFDGVLDQFNEIDSVDFSEKGRSQFLKDIEEMVNDFEIHDKETLNDDGVLDDVQESIKEDNIDVEMVTSDNGHPDQPDQGTSEIESPEQPEKSAATEKVKQMEEVMSNGMDFLSGLLKMATGKDMGLEDKKIEIDKNTGEVTIKFKLPV